jgi:hypothetical protein
MGRQKLCAKCKAAWNREGLVHFDATCDRCNHYLHVCLNCALHDPLAAKGCRERDGEPGPTPDAKNFCDLFKFRETFIADEDDKKLDRTSAKKKWEDLFREP